MIKSHINLALRAWLGTMFAYSSLLKLVHYDDSLHAVQQYALLPSRIATVAGALLPWCELGVAYALLRGRWYPLGPTGVASLGASFAIGSGTALHRKRQTPCGCTGGHDEVVDKWTLGRALAMTAGGLFLIGHRREYQMTFPPLFIVPSLLATSVWPAALAVGMRLSTMRQRRQRARRGTTTVAALVELLASPPADADAVDPR